jgi:hypothetical protein
MRVRKAAMTGFDLAQGSHQMAWPILKLKISQNSQIQKRIQKF